MNTMQSHGTGVRNMIGSLSEPDILASQQYYGQETSGRQPERSLMFAVLLDAVECFQKYALLDDEYATRLFRETENWILDNDREWLFSFINICEAFAIDPRYLRKGLLRWKQHAMHSVSRSGLNALPESYLLGQFESRCPRPIW